MRAALIVGRCLTALLLATALLPSGMADRAAAAEPTGFCGGSYSTNKKYWQINTPSLASVLSHLPADKRKTSGNGATSSAPA